MAPSKIPTLAHIRRAHTVIQPVVQATPLLRAPQLASATGAAEVFLKPESLQRTGSFKFRGAYWRLSQLPPDERARGVIAFSSGNFAQGLAAAGALLHVPVTIVMPFDVPSVKFEATKAYGARVVISLDDGRGREEVAAEVASDIAAHEGLTLLHPFDDPEIIAGQGGVALEAISDAERLGFTFDDVFCPVGGGGLVAGVSLAFHHLSPTTRIVGVEPLGFAGMAASLAAGKRVTVPLQGTSVCDGMMARAPGEHPFSAVRAVGGISSVIIKDRDVRKAQGLAFDTLKLVLEPSGASGLAGFIAQRRTVAGKVILILATGGNTSVQDFI